MTMITNGSLRCSKATVMRLNVFSSSLRAGARRKFISKASYLSNMASQVPLRFDGRVAVVTGAGGGLGKEYALLFAERGAAVVVNDLGGSAGGEGKDQSPAELVVREIKAKGGKAVANYDSVEHGDKIIKTAIDNFGRIDILVNNAGILRDHSIAKTSDEDWDLVHKIHLKAAFVTTRAAWPHFCKQKYGRVIMTSSTSGLLGNFGQTNYSAAKMGLVGLCNTVALEGQKYGIHSNVIVPTAGSRLTQNILPPEVFDQLQPKFVAPIVIWLCHESCEDNGGIFDACGGIVGKFRLQRSLGSSLLNARQELTPEDVRANWDKITEFSNPLYFDSNQDYVMKMMEKITEMKKSDYTISTHQNKSNLTLGDAVGYRFSDVKHSYIAKDIILYALGIGVSTKEEDALKFLYENHEDFSALPTYGVIIAQSAMSHSGAFTGSMPGPSIDLVKVLHGEQYLELLRPLNTEDEIHCESHVADVFDKGSGAVILFNVDGFSGRSQVFRAQFSIFVVGSGGFRGKRTSNKVVPCADPPNRSPDRTVTTPISVDQAALYRLNGDYNPLHIEPDFAAVAGFSRPILHGLCTYGIVGRNVLKVYCNSDVKKFRAIKARFVKPVYPGQTLQTEMWKEGSRVFVRAKVVETGEVALAGGYVDLIGADSVGSVPPNANTSSGHLLLKSNAVFEELKTRLKSLPDIANKVNALYLWVITKDGKPCAHWTVDLRTATKTGEIYNGEPRDGKPHCTLTLDDSDMVTMVSGELDPSKAFMTGKLKITGNIMLTQKLQTLLKRQSKL